MSARPSLAPSLALLLAPLLALAAACGDPPTEIVLVVDTGLAVPAELDAVTIDITGPTRMERKIAMLGPGGTALPLTLGLTRAEGAALSPIGIVVIGQRGGAEIIRRVVSTDFVEGESRLLRVVLVAECLAPRDCGAGNTCSEAGCIPERIRGGTLPPFAAVPRRFDGGSGVVERCNGVDDDGDTMVDEGFDLQNETQNCGMCGNDCSMKTGVVGARCEMGACVIEGCAPNRGDCDTNAENGCEVDLLTDVDHCGSCIGACQALNGEPTCSGGTCSIVCTPGFADCDASPASGCESSLASLESCGRCANRCDMRCGAGYCDDTRVTAVAIGGSHGCALRERGTLVCWGANASGQLGDATTTVRRQPVDVRALTDARSLAAGDAHTCAIRATGGVACWGEGDLGRLGDTGTTDRNTPVAVVDLTGATQLAGGGAHTCALVTDGTVRCWGANMRGQLGDASLVTRVRPVAVSGVADVRAITAGEAHSCALRTDGTVVCWGENRSGQLGDAAMPGDPSELASNVARPVAALDAVTAIASNPKANHSCALRMSGEVLCWGKGTSDQLGTAGATMNARTPVAVALPMAASAIAVGAEHSCAALLDGTVRCWGLNDQGQLGNGSTLGGAAVVSVERTDAMPLGSPTAIEGAGAVVVALGGGIKHTCALTQTGAVYCWGYNNNGQVGDGSSTPNFIRATRVRTLPFP